MMTAVMVGAQRVGTGHVMGTERLCPVNNTK